MVTYVHTQEGFVPLGTTGGAVADTPNHGITVLANTATNTYAMEPPAAGVRKTLISVSTTTTIGATVRGSTATSVKFNAAGATQIVFTATSTVDAVVELVGVNSTRWAVLSLGVNVTSASVLGVT